MAKLPKVTATEVNISNIDEFLSNYTCNMNFICKRLNMIQNELSSTKKLCGIGFILAATYTFLKMGSLKIEIRDLKNRIKALETREEEQ